jgi:hypothetical protein
MLSENNIESDGFLEIIYELSTDINSGNVPEMLLLTFPNFIKM